MLFCKIFPSAVVWKWRHIAAAWKSALEILLPFWFLHKWNWDRNSDILKGWRNCLCFNFVVHFLLSCDIFTRNTTKLSLFHEKEKTKFSKCIPARKKPYLSMYCDLQYAYNDMEKNKWWLVSQRKYCLTFLGTISWK